MTKQERKAVGKLQDLIGRALGDHGNDRDPHGFEKGQKALETAFDICIDLLGKYPPEED